MKWFLDDIKQQEEKYQRLHLEHRGALESLSVQLSTPSFFVDTIEESIKARIRDILTENRDKTAVCKY